MRIGVILVFASVFLAPLFFVPSVTAQSSDRDAVKSIVEEAYVNGVFVDRSEEAVRSGFHPNFSMAVFVDDQLVQASLDMWLERLQLDGVKTNDSIKSQFEQIDITDSTATVKLKLWINDRLAYTDHLGLYKFSEGWRIVNKLFAAHGE